MVESFELPSLMDDDEFIAELEKLEGKAPRPSADRASRVALATGFNAADKPVPSASTRPTPQREQPEADAIEPILRRDVDRWNVHPQPNGSALEPTVDASASGSAIPAFLIIMIGFGTGAAGSAVMLHERVVQIVALFAR
jgi:hypothetical protein